MGGVGRGASDDRFVWDGDRFGGRIGHCRALVLSICGVAVANDGADSTAAGFLRARLARDTDHERAQRVPLGDAFGDFRRSCVDRARGHRIRSPETPALGTLRSVEVLEALRVGAQKSNLAVLVPYGGALVPGRDHLPAEQLR